jgi:hypothetical protein
MIGIFLSFKFITFFFAHTSSHSALAWRHGSYMRDLNIKKSYIHIQHSHNKLTPFTYDLKKANCIPFMHHASFIYFAYPLSFHSSSHNSKKRTSKVTFIIKPLLQYSTVRHFTSKNLRPPATNRPPCCSHHPHHYLQVLLQPLFFFFFHFFFFLIRMLSSLSSEKK